MLNPYAAILNAQKKPALPDHSFGPSAPVGLGFDYSSPTRSKGFPTELLPAFGQAAGYVGQGSELAAGALKRSSDALFNARASGIVGGRAEERRRLGFESGATGYSPELLRRMSFAQDAGDQAAISEAQGGAMAGYEDALAELLKGTGTELAGLKTNELGMLMQAFLNYKGRAAARKAGKNQVLGDVLGLVSSVGSAAFSPAPVAPGAPDAPGSRNVEF